MACFHSDKYLIIKILKTSLMPLTKVFGLGNKSKNRRCVLVRKNALIFAARLEMAS